MEILIEAESPAHALKAEAESGRASSCFLPVGEFCLGANYWASHAGIFMWRDWRADIIEQDFLKLAGIGLTAIRVFPLWPDFQPLHELRGVFGRTVEYRHGEAPLASQSGVSEAMLDRFETMADLASENGLDLVVGLLTGWMSGRFFAPPALEHRNAITDPVSIQWQVRFLSTFVSRFRGHPAIKAWDLGNECNCMGIASREEAWLWTATVANAIRASDPTRPVISGMHSLGAGYASPWTIRDQGELTDFLTTHPYPLFTPHCNREPITTIRPLLHATAETCLYADLAGKPAFVEEFGTLGPMVCGDESARAMARSRLIDLWAHDCRAAFWWCAHDQSEISSAPHDWIPLERELGLFRSDGSRKPVAESFSSFRATVEALPIRSLPRRRTDAVCLLSPGQDSWGVAYSAFILAKQAGFDIRFHYTEEDLPDADCYLLPSIKGLTPLSRRVERSLWEKIERGADLFVSFDEQGFLGEWIHKTGVIIDSSYQQPRELRFRFPDFGNERSMVLPCSVAWNLRVPFTTNVLVSDEAENPLFFVNNLKLGRIWSFMAPLEATLAAISGAFGCAESLPFWRIYHRFSEGVRQRRAISKNLAEIGITEHRLPNGHLVAVFNNYAPSHQQDIITIRPSWQFKECWLGTEPFESDGQMHLTIGANQVVIWHLAPRV